MHNNNIRLNTTSSEFISYTKGDKMGTSHNTGEKKSKSFVAEASFEYCV